MRPTASPKVMFAIRVPMRWHRPPRDTMSGSPFCHGKAQNDDVPRTSLFKLSPSVQKQGQLRELRRKV